MIVSSMMLVSCLDTIILPDDKTVDEDFWKTKQQVGSMVTAAYAAMASNDVMAHLLVWGESRTDEVLGPSSNVDNSTTKTALDEISAVNIQTTNMFAQWTSLYTVISKIGTYPGHDTDLILTYNGDNHFLHTYVLLISFKYFHFPCKFILIAKCYIYMT